MLLANALATSLIVKMSLQLPPKHSKHKIKSAFEAAQPETPNTDSSSDGERLGDYNSSSLGSLSSGASSMIPAGFSGEL